MTEFTVPIVTGQHDPFTIHFDQLADDISVFEQTIADLNEYNDGLSDRGGARSNDTWTLNQLYAGLPLKDEPPEFPDDSHFDLLSFGDASERIAGLSTASTSGHPDVETPSNDMRYMLRNTESPPLNLSQVIDWTDYFANETESTPTATTTTATENIVTETKIKSERDDDNKNDDSGNDTSSDEQSIRIKSEPDLDIDDRASEQNSTSGFSSNVELTEEVTQNVNKLTNKINSTGRFVTAVCVLPTACDESPKIVSLTT